MFPLYDEGRSKTWPIVSWTLIILNVICFIWELSVGVDVAVDLYGVRPIYLQTSQRLFTFIISTFLHADITHILGNMIYLFVFGDNVEERFGRIKYLIFYLIFGLAGGLMYSAYELQFGGLVSWDGLIIDTRTIPSIGASGAISGILGAYLVFFPRKKIVSIVPSFYFLRLARVPAIIFIGFWFILQLLYIGGISSVAYTAHIGGFLTGVIVAIALKLKRQSNNSLN